MLRAVLFDLDDTLVDQKSAAEAAVVAWAAEHGITDPDVRQRWARISEFHYERYQHRELTFAQQRTARVREFLAIDVDEHRASHLFDGYLTRYEALWIAFDDAVPALRRARLAGLTIAVLTNGDEEHQRFKLTKLSLLNEIDMLIASSALPAGKPDPRAFAHALDRIGVTPDQAVMIGDSLEKDVHGAMNAGLNAVLLDRRNAWPDIDVPRVKSLDGLTFTATLNANSPTSPTSQRQLVSPSTQPNATTSKPTTSARESKPPWPTSSQP
ncbi:MAG: HAD family hydrolase [Mycobacterium sp.]|nr:HAD family hydrolase [Mycobacterium sp.]